MVEIWQYIIGAVFCITILFFKGGIVGFVKDQLPEMIASRKNKKSKAEKVSAEKVKV